MRSVVVFAFAAFVLMVVGLLGAVPTPSAAMQIDTPEPVCDENLIVDEEAEGTGFVDPGQESGEDPPEGIATVLKPPGQQHSEVLYLTVVTLPEDACYGYRQRLGAVVLFVQSGSIVYTATATDAAPNPKVTTGDSDPAGNVEDVALDTELTVEEGHWVSQSSPLWYTFHNPGPGEATVAIASYVVPPWLEGDPCSSGCRTP